MEKVSEWLGSFKSQNQATDAHKTGKVSLPKKNYKISITGGKGGVGKTSVSLKFARELSLQGYRVLLIDCDYNLSNTAIKLGLPLNNKFWDLLSSEKTFSDCLYKEGNLHLLAACNGSVELFESKLKLDEIIIDIISTHEDEYDFILLDCPAGLSRESLNLNAYCDQRFVVVTPDKASITDSYSLIKVLNQRYGVKENHLLINMYATQKQYEKVVKTLSETVEHFLGSRTYLLGGLRKLDVTQDQFDNFFLFNQESEAHKSFLKLLERYTDQLSKSRQGSGANVPEFALEHEVH